MSCSQSQTAGTLRMDGWESRVPMLQLSERLPAAFKQNPCLGSTGVGLGPYKCQLFFFMSSQGLYSG